MPYAIVQTTLDKPPVESLRTAFRQVKWLTDIDAATMAHDGYGIIVEDLSYAKAEAVSNALNTVGVLHKMIDQSNLPELGMRRLLRRMECTEEGPVLYDPLGRPVYGNWSDIRLVAAGLVGMHEIQRIQKQRVKQVSTGMYGGAMPVVVTDISEKMVGIDKLVMELYMGDAFARFRIVADKFHFNCPIDQIRPPLPRRFASLVRDVANHAPDAIFSQGVQSLVDDLITTFAYPSEHAFLEEIRWLRWMASSSEG